MLVTDAIHERQRIDTEQRIKGRMFAGKRIIEVGFPVDNRLNRPVLVPFRLEDGTYRIFWNEDEQRIIISNNLQLEHSIIHSTRMPEVAPGIGTDVMHVKTYPKKPGVAYAFGKVYYTALALGQSRDYYREVSHDEAKLVEAERKIRSEPSPYA